MSQVVNYSHLFPTRYALELESLKGSVSNDTFKEPSQREDAKKNIKKLFEERYTTGKNKWFFQALRVRLAHTTLKATMLILSIVLSVSSLLHTQNVCIMTPCDDIFIHIQALSTSARAMFGHTSLGAE